MTEPEPPSHGGPEGRSPLESTGTLLARVRQGDTCARDELFARYLPRLRRWAHGRLPVHAREMGDTDDLVQNSLLRALSHVGTFQPQHNGAFAGYLHRTLLNQIRDQVRRAARRPRHQGLDAELRDPGISPLERVVGNEMLERYEQALAGLAPEPREAVVLRLELGFTYQEIADAQGRPSADAARQVILRALVRVAREMHDHR